MVSWMLVMISWMLCYDYLVIVYLLFCVLLAELVRARSGLALARLIYSFCENK
jgi:hypothetical protein